jgi:hypothetical protein
MNFRTGFNFFKQTTRMFRAPSVPFAAYSNNMQKVVNKALIKYTIGYKVNLLEQYN